MQLNQNIVSVDIKLQDKARQLLSRLNGSLKVSCFQLGDSDIDYEISPNKNNARILNAPYNVPAIKYPLIVNGAGKGLKGTISCFLRYVDANGNISSLYNYPPSLTFTNGIIPPTLDEGYDWTQVNFTNVKIGVIMYFQTLLDYYMDNKGKQERLPELYDMKVFFSGNEIIPNGWQIIKDLNNGSLLLGKDSTISVTPGNYQGLVQITGKLTKQVRTIQFNI